MFKYSIVFAVTVQIAGTAQASLPPQPSRSPKATAAAAPGAASPAAPGPRPAQPIARAQFVAKLDQNFQALDANHDGLLTLDEVKAAQVREQQKIAGVLAARRAEQFARLDTNKDGVISRAEFMAGVPTPKFPDPSAGFGALDVNHDGKVTLDEFRGPQLTRFNALDTNHDGVITPQELSAARVGASRAAVPPRR